VQKPPGDIDFRYLLLKESMLTSRYAAGGMPRLQIFTGHYGTLTPKTDYCQCTSKEARFITRKCHTGVAFAIVL
jgi:hypothetical protein